MTDLYHWFSRLLKKGFDLKRNYEAIEANTVVIFRSSTNANKTNNSMYFPSSHVLSSKGAF